jgi:hypothetical protein
VTLGYSRQCGAHQAAYQVPVLHHAATSSLVDFKLYAIFKDTPETRYTK